MSSRLVYDIKTAQEAMERYERALEEEPELTRKQELERQLDSLIEILQVHAMERNAELRNDPTVDHERIPDLLRIELAQIRAQRDRLYNQLRGLNAELGFGREMGIER